MMMSEENQPPTEDPSAIAEEASIPAAIEEYRSLKRTGTVSELERLREQYGHDPLFQAAIRVCDRDPPKSRWLLLHRRWLWATVLICAFGTVAMFVVVYFARTAFEARVAVADRIGKAGVSNTAKPALPAQASTSRPEFQYVIKEADREVFKESTLDERRGWSKDAQYEWVKVAVAAHNIQEAWQRIEWIEKNCGTFPRLEYAKGVLYQFYAEPAVGATTQTSTANDAQMEKAEAAYLESIRLAEQDDSLEARDVMSQSHNNLAVLYRAGAATRHEPSDKTYFLKRALDEAKQAVRLASDSAASKTPPQVTNANVLDTLATTYKDMADLAATKGNAADATKYRRLALQGFKQAWQNSDDSEWRAHLSEVIRQLE